MKIEILDNLCDNCGVCVDTFPEIFTTISGKVRCCDEEAINRGNVDEHEIIEFCPKGAIHLFDDSCFEDDNEV